jgi:predicted DNA-binding transcriptional regulator AlpA
MKRKTTKPSAAKSVALPDEDLALIRLPLVLHVFPIGKSSWWNGIAEGRYPKPVRLSKRAVAWRVSDIRRLLSSFVSSDADR